jgi:hypothetical protein
LSKDFNPLPPRGGRQQNYTIKLFCYTIFVVKYHILLKMGNLAVHLGTFGAEKWHRIGCE